MEQDINKNYQAIVQRVHRAAQEHARSSQEICLLAVSKGQSAAAIKQLYELGVTQFGENYWQEARDKLQALSTYPIQWHFLGQLQSNKIKSIAQHFSWVHSVTRLSELELFAKHRPSTFKPINICLEVLVPGALNAAALPLDEISGLLERAQGWPKLRIRGLMVMAAPHQSDDQTRAVFHQVHEAFVRLKSQWDQDFDTLSMGMSSDFEFAIAEGSTMVRIGRSLFE